MSPVLNILDSRLFSTFPSGYEHWVGVRSVAIEVEWKQRWVSELWKQECPGWAWDCTSTHSEYQVFQELAARACWPLTDGVCVHHGGQRASLSWLLHGWITEVKDVVLLKHEHVSHVEFFSIKLNFQMKNIFSLSLSDLREARKETGLMWRFNVMNNSWEKFSC